MSDHTFQRALPFVLCSLLASGLVHCAGGEELDFTGAHAGGAGKSTSKTGSGGSLAAGGAAGNPAGGGDSSTGGSSMDDASSAGGQAGVTGGSAGAPLDSGAAGGAVADVVNFDVAPCTTCALSVQYSLQKMGDTSQEIGFDLSVKNTGANVVTVNQIALRYWYTIDGEAGQEGVIDYSMTGATMQFSKVMPARTGADYYAEMKFTGAGQLATGQVALLNGRFHKANYQGTYKQTDDYSYGAGHTDLADWPKITAYIGGGATPVWGTEP